MKKEKLMLINRILLGLVMLVPGLIKIGALKFLGESFTMSPAMVTGMLDGFGFPAATFLAWILILSEIVFGIAILSNYKLKYVVWPPAIILVVASFTAHWASWPAFLVHIALATNYILWGLDHGKK